MLFTYHAMHMNKMIHFNDLDLTIQIIEFTFTHDRFLDQAIQTKEDKYNLLVNTIGAQD